jgi:hypothetical protein
VRKICVSNRSFPPRDPPKLDSAVQVGGCEQGCKRCCCAGENLFRRWDCGFSRFLKKHHWSVFRVGRPWDDVSSHGIVYGPSHQRCYPTLSWRIATTIQLHILTVYVAQGCTSWTRPMNCSKLASLPLSLPRSFLLILPSTLDLNLLSQVSWGFHLLSWTCFKHQDGVYIYIHDI